MTKQILIVDDEPAIRRLVSAALGRAGYAVTEAPNAADALIFARRPGCELILLDLGLPDRDGLELISLLKAMDREVIVLTARDNTSEKVTALDLGADDYIVKPFDTEELLARVRTALRRRSPGSSVGGPVIFGDVVIDTAARHVSRDGREVHLTPKEYGVLAELARHLDRVITHTELLAVVWGLAHKMDVEYLRVAVRSLRLKLERDPANPDLIRNEPGVGYRLMASPRY
jgi:two-component system KDP operon response regulator KdpE